MGFRSKLLDEVKSAEAFARAILDELPPEYAAIPNEVLTVRLREGLAHLEHVSSLKEKAVLVEKLKYDDTLLMAREMSSICSRLKVIFHEAKNDNVMVYNVAPPWEFAHDIFVLGRFQGIMEGRSIEAGPDFRRMLQSLLGAENVNERWKEDREDYESAEKEARSYYEEGGKDTHDKVARRLAKKYNLSPNTVRDKIKPIARKYGKVKGDPR